MYIKHIYICNIYIYYIVYIILHVYMYIHICLSPLYTYYYICTFNGKNWVIKIWKCSKNHLPQTAARPAATPSTGVKFPSGLWSGNLPSRYAHTPRDPPVIGSSPPQKKVGQVVSSHFPWFFLNAKKKKTDPKVGVETAGVLGGCVQVKPWHVLSFPSQRLSQFYLCKYAGFMSWS